MQWRKDCLSAKGAGTTEYTYGKKTKKRMWIQSRIARSYGHSVPWKFCPLDSKEIKPVKFKGDQPWIFTGRTDAEAEAPVF